MRGVHRLNTRKWTQRVGWTLLELLVVMAIVAVLVALLFVGVTHVQATSHRATCMSNLRQIGAALLLRASEHDGYLPNQLPGGQGNPGWHFYVRDYLDWGNHGTHSRVGNCPAHPRLSNNNQFKYKRSYAMNSSYTPSFWQTKRVRYPAEAFLVGENRATSETRRITPGDMGFEHNGYTNLLFLDGHVESRTLEMIPPHSDRHQPHYVRFWRPLEYRGD